jgi:hypothetical protein
MKELGLQELLRYALSGGIGFASLLLMYPKIARSIGDVKGAEEVTLIFGAVLVAGTLVYNIHRSLLFPPLLRWIGFFTLRPQKTSLWMLLFPLLWWLPSVTEMEVDRWRWKLKKGDRRPWDEWGAQIHFLYCAAWATLAAFVFGRYIAFGGCRVGPPSCHARHFFEVVFWGSLGAGVVSNIRLLYHINAARHQP